MSRDEVNNRIAEYLDFIESGASVSIRENGRVHMDGFISPESLSQVVKILVDGGYCKQ